VVRPRTLLLETGRLLITKNFASATRSRVVVPKGYNLRAGGRGDRSIHDRPGTFGVGIGRGRGLLSARGQPERESAIGFPLVATNRRCRSGLGRCSSRRPESSSDGAAPISLKRKAAPKGRLPGGNLVRPPVMDRS
jgi:hypothetical protein